MAPRGPRGSSGTHNGTSVSPRGRIAWDVCSWAQQTRAAKYLSLGGTWEWVGTRQDLQVLGSTVGSCMPPKRSASTSEGTPSSPS